MCDFSNIGNQNTKRLNTYTYTHTHTHTFTLCLMSIFSEFPKGYDVLPRPFVAVYGNYKFHSNVVRTLIACQAEDSHLKSKEMCKIVSVPDSFKIPPKNKSFLKRREEGKNKNFVGIDPDGVFKYGWCWKWLSKVPCCVVNLVDYTNGDWECTMKETEKTFFSEIEELKNTIGARHRDTNVISLLIVSDDCNESLMNDLASNLRHGVARTVYAVKVSEINSGGKEPASATIQRTMRSVRHHASTCYTRQMRKYRIHRVEKRTQRALDVRHLFKQAFMNEFLGQIDRAVSCYREAFDSALHLTCKDTKLGSFGIKAIVGLINFRMTHALLNSNRVHDAVLQFNRFSKIFENRVEDDECLPRHWAWLTETYSEFGALLERCDDDLKKPIRDSADDGQRLDSQFREGYYYDFAVRVANKRKEAAMRNSIKDSALSKKTSKVNYEISRMPFWVGGDPTVIPTQTSISDLTPYLQQQQQQQHLDDNSVSVPDSHRRRRRGATAERSPSVDVSGGRDEEKEMKQAVPNPFECLESDVDHAHAILDLLVRARISQSLFAEEGDNVESKNIKEKFDGEEDEKIDDVLLTPQPSHRAKAYENLGKTIPITKDERGHLGIKFDDALKVR